MSFGVDVESFRGAGVQQAIKGWQKEIGVTADGVFGPATEAATKKWQSANGVEPDGIVGPLTWGALLGPTDFDYPATLSRTTANAAPVGVSPKPPIPVAVTTTTVTPTPVIVQTVPVQKPMLAGMLDGPLPLILGVLLVGGAVYTQVQKNTLSRR